MTGSRRPSPLPCAIPWRGSGQGGRAHFLHSQKTTCKSLMKNAKILAPYLAHVRVEGSNPFSRSRFSEPFQGARADRKSVVSGKSVAVGVDLGGRVNLKKKKT